MVFSVVQSSRRLPRFPASSECVSDAEPDTRELVRAQNKKKKKSGGFQSMGETSVWNPADHSPGLCLCRSVSVLCFLTGLSYPMFKGIMKKGYKVPTPIQRKVKCSLHISVRLGETPEHVFVEYSQRDPNLA